MKWDGLIDHDLVQQTLQETYFIRIIKTQILFNSII